MTWQTLGVVVDGHVDRQMSDQRRLWSEIDRSWEEAQPAEARAGPSSRVSMWVSRMSGWTAENVVAPPPTAAGVGGSVAAEEGCIFSFSFF